MNIREMATQYKMAQWSQVMQERAASGMSIADFCKTKGIQRQNYFYWQKKLREAAVKELDQGAAPEPGSQALVPSGWAMVGQEEEIAPTGAKVLTLRIGGAEIEVHQGYDEALLVSVIKTLSQAC